GPGVRQRTPQFRGLQPGQLLGVVDDELEGAAEDLGTFARRGRRPLRLRGAGQVEGAARVLSGGGRDLRKHGAVGGVDHLEGAGVGGVEEVPVEEESLRGGGEKFGGIHASTFTPYSCVESRTTSNSSSSAPVATG